MITAKVTNNSTAIQGVRGISGVEYIKPGDTRKMEFSAVELERAKTRRFLTIVDDDPVITPVAPSALDEGKSLVARHKGAGKYSIWSGEDEISSGLTKGDAEAFNAMSDEDKAEYVAK